MFDLMSAPVSGEASGARRRLVGWTDGWTDRWAACLLAEPAGRHPARTEASYPGRRVIRAMTACIDRWADKWTACLFRSQDCTGKENHPIR
jgi:hypothetical protein